MTLFAENRTDLRHGKTFQGVETPSQTRYVGYYEKILHVYNHEMPPVKYLKLRSIVISAIESREISFRKESFLNYLYQVWEMGMVVIYILP